MYFSPMLIHSCNNLKAYLVEGRKRRRCFFFWHHTSGCYSGLDLLTWILKIPAAVLCLKEMAYQHTWLKKKSTKIKLETGIYPHLCNTLHCEELVWHCVAKATLQGTNCAEWDGREHSGKLKQWFMHWPQVKVMLQVLECKRLWQQPLVWKQTAHKTS